MKLKAPKLLSCHTENFDKLHTKGYSQSNSNINEAFVLNAKANPLKSRAMPMSGFLMSSLAKTDASAFTENILPMVSRVPTNKNQGFRDR